MADQTETPSTPHDDTGNEVPQVETTPLSEPTETITDEESPEVVTTQPPQTTTVLPPAGKFPKLKRLARAYWAKKKWTVPVTVVVLLLALFGLPFMRNLTLGLFMHNRTKVTVYDAKTNRPVSGADVSLGSVQGKTDSGGNVLLSPHLGNKKLVISKKYYTGVSQTVTVTWPTKLAKRVALNPTGRLVPIILINKLTGKPVVDAIIKAAGTETHTDKAGKATIVLPTTAPTQTATVTLPSYNTITVTIQVTDQVVPTNSFMLTPSGKVYFLSNQSGKIDVVKTNLDGTDRQTVFAGSGSEDAQTTSLLASRDWKYLVLLSKHSANSPSLYLINTSNDQVTNIDGGSPTTTFTLVGWTNDSFVYQVNRSTVSSWQSGAAALKGYDAAAGKLYSIDQTQGEGTSAADFGYTQFTSVYLIKNEIVYGKNWYSSFENNHLSGKSDSVYSVDVDGTNKKSVKDFPVPAGTSYYYGINLAAFEPGGVYIQVPNSDNTNTYYAYEDGKVSPKSDVTDDIFNKPYSTYLASPSGKQTFWSEVRDNKNTLFVGGDNAQSPNQIASLSDYTPYGWYTDAYLLVSKNGSELYAMTPDTASSPKKITDYYKPQLTYRGYGGGYGGL